MATGLSDLHNLIPRKTWPALPAPVFSVSCISMSLHLLKIHENGKLNSKFLLAGNFKVSMINIYCMKFTKSSKIRLSYVDMKKK